MRLPYIALLLLATACSSDPAANNSEPADQGVTKNDVSTDAGPDVASTTPDVGTQEDAPTGADMVENTPDAANNNPMSGWHDRQALPAEQQETAVVAFQDRIWVMGGFNAGGQEIATVNVYDPATDSWDTAADFPLPAHHMNAAVYDGQIWVTGFLAGGFAPDGRTFVYDPTDDQWTPGPDLPQERRRGASAVGVIDEKIYVAGGVGAGGAVALFDVLDPTTSVWTELPDLPRDVDHAAFGVVDGTLIVAAGRDSAISAHTDRVELFDPADGTWQTGAPIPTARGGVASAVWDGKLYVFGGEGDPDSPGNVFPQVEAYDFAADEWEQLADMPSPRHGLGAAALDGVIYLPGGAPTQFLDATDVHQVYVP